MFKDKIFIFLFITINLVIIFFRINYWPVTNFSVFNRKATFDQFVVYRWAEERNGRMELIPFRKTNIHDSFTRGVQSTKKDLNELGSYMKKFISGEMKVLHKFEPGKKVYVYELVLKKENEDCLNSFFHFTKNLLKQNNQCVKENAVFTITL